MFNFPSGKAILRPTLTRSRAQGRDYSEKLDQQRASQARGGLSFGDADLSSSQSRNRRRLEFYTELWPTCPRRLLLHAQLNHDSSMFAVATTSSREYHSSPLSSTDLAPNRRGLWVTQVPLQENDMVVACTASIRMIPVRFTRREQHPTPAELC